MRTYQERIWGSSIKLYAGNGILISNQGSSYMVSSSPMPGPANKVFATPDGVDGDAALRALTLADFPDLDGGTWL